MANKLYAMELLTEEVAKDVAANPQEWMRFLNTASRLYRYTFPEQLLIYAQRPGATAVASMEIWNQKMYRWIKKGSKGIALIDNTSGPKTKLRYVFDVQDTYKVKNLGRDPQLWNLNPVARPAHFLLPPGEEPLASLPLLFPVQAVPADNLPPVVLLLD